jgi:hypothetical protein
MKFITLLFVLFAFPAISSAEDDLKPDAVELALREVYKSYKAGEDKQALDAMREVVKLLEVKVADKVGEQLPEKVGDWKGESLKKEDLALLGGGISISRTYVLDDAKITVKVMKDVPALKGVMALLGNEELLKLGNRKTMRISGQTAVMEGEHKLQIVLDGRIYVELLGNDKAGERELVSFARKLDLRAISKME